MKKILLCLFATLQLCNFANAQKPELLQHNTTSYIDDYADIYTPEQEQSLDKQIRAFHDTVQISLVTVKSLEGNDPVEYATKLGNLWGVGSKSNNGLLILLAPIDKKYAVVTGKGIQGDLTDLQTASIYREKARPFFKEAKWFEGSQNLINGYIYELSPASKEIRKAQEKKKQEKYAETISAVKTVGVVLLIIVLIVALIVILVNKSKRNKQSAITEEREFSSDAYRISSKLTAYNRVIEQGIKLNIPEAETAKSILAILNSKTPTQISSLIGKKQIKNFISEYKKIESSLKSAVDVIQEKLFVYQKAANFLDQIDTSKEYLRQYKEYTEDKFPLNFRDEHVEEILPNILKTYGKLITNHIELRENLLHYLKEGKFDKLSSCVSSISTNVSNIANIQETLENIKRDDALKLQTGRNAKKLVREKAHALLSYCTEKSCSKEKRDAAREGIQLVMEKTIDMGSDSVKNYAIYLTLMHELEAFNAPYLAYKEREKNESEAKVREESRNRESTRSYKDNTSTSSFVAGAVASSLFSSNDDSSSSSSYSSSNDDSSSSSSDFGGGSFDGGGSGGDM